jgi:CO/xanthine dehydrogenase Mo-binding subunit
VTSRRSFLKASLALAAAPSFVLAIGSPDASSSEDTRLRADYLRIEADGSIIVVSAVAEIGQGTSTALAMILADALDADWSKVRYELAGVAPQFVNPTYGMQLTGASTGISGFHDRYRMAGATARAMLVSAAAKRWGVKPTACTTDAGRVFLKGTRNSLSYGQLAAAAGREPVPTLSPDAIRPVGRFVGKSVPRLDIPSKVNGTAQYAIDVRLPNMLYAAVTLAPVFGGKLAKDNRAVVLKREGVHAVVDLPNGVAIIADRWWTAHTAIEELSPEWAATPNDSVSDETVSAQLWNDLASQSGTLAKSSGNPSAAFSAAQKVQSSRYEVPFLAHATMEPMSCVARVDANGCEIWVGSQRPDRARQAAAELLGIPESAVIIHPVLAGGGFGRRQEPDVVLQAVAIAKAVQGKPVKLVWSRENDVQHDAYRPAGVSELSAVIADGTVTAFRHRQASPSVLPRSFPAVFAMLPYDTSVADSSYPLYEFPNTDAWWVRSETHVPAGMWRSVGASQTIFAIESFMDELALSLGQDAYEFRKERLRADPRALRVWNRLGEMCDWASSIKHGRALGLAISHKNDDCLVAQAAEVALRDGQVQVKKIWTVADPGRVIAPDIARAQLEGAAIWALTAALYGKITIDKGRVQEGNFDTYQMVRLADTPAFETEFLESGAKLEGIGEGGAPGVAPAVCNALFRLTGKRVRRLPIASQFSN